MIIIVDNTFWAGLIVRWYLTDKPEDCGEMVQPDVSASREGVMVGTFLHRVEGSVLDHAKGLHATLAEGRDEDLKQIRLAIPTHARVPGGVPVAVGGHSAFIPDRGPNYHECAHCPDAAAMSQAALDQHVRLRHLGTATNRPGGDS